MNEMIAGMDVEVLTVYLEEADAFEKAMAPMTEEKLTQFKAGKAGMAGHSGDQGLGCLRCSA